MPRRRPDGPTLQLRRGLWHVVWWEGGQRRRLSTGETDEGRARQALADFERAAAQRPLRLTVDEALTRYEQDREGKVEAIGRLREAAAALREGLGPLRIDQIDQARWDRYAAARVTRPRPRKRADASADRPEAPRPVAPGTLRREFNVLRAALRLAWKAGHLPRPPALTPPPDGAPRHRYLTKAEARRLVDACVSPHVRIFVALAVYTGARKGAILGLRWSQVDFATGRIDFAEPGRVHSIKRRAIVPMTDALRAELLAAQALRTDKSSGFVVEYNDAPVPTGLRWSFQRLCKRAGLSWTPTPHHLRHSVASWMAMAGVSIDQTADFLALDPRTLRRVYRKFDPEYLREAAKALAL